MPSGISRLIVVLAAAGGLAAFPGSGVPALAQDGEHAAAEIIAAHIRQQGFACEKAIGGAREPGWSRPDEAAWLLKCSNRSYRVRLVPDMAAHVTPLD